MTVGVMRVFGFCCISGILLVACGRRTQPRLEEVASFDTAGWAHDIALSDNELYVSDRQGGFLLFDRSRGWTAPRIAAPVADVISLAPNGGQPLLASRFDGLVLVSRDNNVVARYSNGDIANAVAVRGNLAFAAYGLHGLVIARIKEDGIHVASELPSPGWSHDVKLWQDRALLADWNYGLRVVNIANPERPVEVAVLPTPATTISVSLRDMPAKPMAALAEGHAGIAIVSFDGSGRPSLQGRHSLGLNPRDSPHPETGGWAHGIAWCGDYLFVANWKKGLAVLDVHDVRNPRPVLEHPTKGTSLAVAAEPERDGSILVFLADGEAGLRVIRFRP